MPPIWITAWVLFSGLIVTWEAGFCFMRPRSFSGGDLSWFWAPLDDYQKLDLMYGPSTYEAKEGWLNAQATLNLVETFLNLIALCLSSSPAAALLLIVSASITIAKTFLFLLQEYFCDWCKLGHNLTRDIVRQWLVPALPWIIVPALIAWTQGKDLCARLAVAGKVKST